MEKNAIMLLLLVSLWDDLVLNDCRDLDRYNSHDATGDKPVLASPRGIWSKISQD